MIQHSAGDGPPQGDAAVIPQEETRLVAAAKAGDSAAFTALVKSTQADVYTLAYRLTGNEDDARDVTQEAYLRAFRSLKRFRGDARFSTWMFRITANSASTYLTRRTKGRYEQIGDDIEVLDERPEADPESMAEAGALRDKVTAALADLPPILRAVVVLRDVYDLPHDVIAKELGITESTAKVRLHRARRKLREKLFPGVEPEKEAAPQPTEAEIARLPELLREVARAVLVQGLSRTEVIETLGITESVYSGRLHRAKRHLERMRNQKR